MNDYKELERLVIEWAKQKGILEKATTIAQAGKTMEECTELMVAIARHDDDEILDALGDILVTIIIQAEMQGVCLVDCLAMAYNVISKRTGKMVNGTFVKDSEKKDDSFLITKGSWETADKISHEGFIYVKYNDLKML